MSLDLSSYRFLSVDDTAVNNIIFKGLLKATGVTVDALDSGRKALDMVKEIKYDIIFLDHMMPQMDGIETLKRIKSDSDSLNKDTPVIMITGNEAEENAEMYEAAGAYSYIIKPVEQAVLLGMIEKVLK